eukprot:2567096-Pyramimonas_sp.AAC.1
MVLLIILTSRRVLIILLLIFLPSSSSPTTVGRPAHDDRQLSVASMHRAQASIERDGSARLCNHVTHGVTERQQIISPEARRTSGSNKCAAQRDSEK